MELTCFGKLSIKETQRANGSTCLSQEGRAVFAYLGDAELSQASLHLSALCQLKHTELCDEQRPLRVLAAQPHGYDYD